VVVLVGEEVGLHEGDVDDGARGVRHKAQGDLTVLVVCILPAVLGYAQELE
jgi:hypothetical protein